MNNLVNNEEGVDHWTECPVCEGELDHYDDKFEYWGCIKCGDVFVLDKRGLIINIPEVQYIKPSSDL